MSDKEQAWKEYTDKLYEEHIIIDNKHKEAFFKPRSLVLETLLYRLTDEDYINYLDETNMESGKVD